MEKKVSCLLNLLALLVTSDFAVGLGTVMRPEEENPAGSDTVSDAGREQSQPTDSSEEARSEKTPARFRELSKALQYHRRRYYLEDDPEISDAEYDELEREFHALARAFPKLVPADDLFGTVGAEVLETDFATVAHREPMYSLDNAMDADELFVWGRRVARLSGDTKIVFVCEPKIDGLSVSLTYRDGELCMGATRGNGREGEDVTPNVRTVAGVPQRLSRALSPSPPAELEVRGEVYLSVSQFQELNRKQAEAGEKIYANPRNAAAGGLRQKDSRKTAERHLSMFAYELGYGQGLDFAAHTEKLAWLSKAGFFVSDLVKTFENLDDVREYCLFLQARRHELDFAFDGVVVKIQDLAAREKLGFTAKAPRWAIAWKFPPEERTTRLLDIKVGIGRTGRVTPYGVLAPVRLSGAGVTQATLHNMQELTRKGLRIGDTVLVRRAGEVIPEIIKPIVERRDGTERPFHMPERCPDCGSPIVQPEDEVNHRCTGGWNCPAQVEERILHFASRAGMDIEHLGEKTVAALLERGLIQDVGDLYGLSIEALSELTRSPSETAETQAGTQREASKPRSVSKPPGFAERSVRQLLQLAREVEQMPDKAPHSFARLLQAFHLKGGGSRAMTVLAERFLGWDALFAASPADFVKLPGIGKISAAQLHESLHNPDFQEVVQKIRAAARGKDTLSAGPPFSLSLGLTFDDLAFFRGFNVTSLRNLLEAIADSKDRPFAQVLRALGLRHLGSANATALTAVFPSLDALCAADPEEIAAIEGFGEVKAASIFAELRDPQLVEIFDKLRANGMKLEEPQLFPQVAAPMFPQVAAPMFPQMFPQMFLRMLAQVASQVASQVAAQLAGQLFPQVVAQAAGLGEEAARSLQGFSFVLSGKLGNHSREDLQQKLRALGAKTPSAISKKTDVLFAGSKAGSKVKKAALLDVRIGDLALLEAVLEQGSAALEVK